MGVTAGLMQEVQLAEIPLPVFEAYRDGDLEIYPSQNWTNTGWIHSNGHIYFEPDGAAVRCEGYVTSSHFIVTNAHPNDPLIRSPGPITFVDAEGVFAESKAASISVPIGTNLHQILDEPPLPDPLPIAGQQQRFYNKADLILVTTNQNYMHLYGRDNSGGLLDLGTALPWYFAYPTTNYVSTNSGWWMDQVEGKNLVSTDVDLGAFGAAYGVLQGLIGREPMSLYVRDLRVEGVGWTNAVRLLNGAQVPGTQLTVSTPNLLYVCGPFNTVDTKPVLVAGDAVTLLSGVWTTNIHGDGPVANRAAVSTEFRMHVVTGIVPSSAAGSSGGISNALRLLENWSSRTLTFYGSIAVLYDSQVLTVPWSDGIGVGFIPPGTRRMFTALPEMSFVDASPPQAYTVIRSAWVRLPPWVTSP
jgi:hypothetical protein